VALPPGITPKTVTLGIASFADGNLATGRATISMPVNVLHTPTNRPIFSSEMTKPFVDGEVTFDLLPNDAPGLNRVDWSYKLKVEISGATVQPEVIYFLLPTAGPDTVDLDGLVTVPSSAGIPISVDVLTAADVDPTLASLITPGGSATATALAADPALRAAFVASPLIATSAAVHVATDGNDSNNGRTWATAKATIAAAIAALPTNGGTVELGYGTFNVASTGRRGAVTLTSGSADVADTNAAAGDVGAYVIVGNTTDVAVITAVTPGTGFTMSRPAATSGARTAIVTKPGLVLPAGVRLRGRGTSYEETNPVQTRSHPATTEIHDTGTGVTIMCEHLGLDQSAMSYQLTDLALTGNPSNYFGLAAMNIWFLQLSNLEISNHGVAGLLGSLNENSWSVRDVRFIKNGSTTSNYVTGGVLLNTPGPLPSAALLFENCFFTNNYGFGVVGASDFTTPIGAFGAVFLSCQWNATRKSGRTDSGWGAYLGADYADSAMIGCWFEGSSAGSLKVDDFGSLTAINCHFNGAVGDSGDNANGVQVLGLAMFIAIGCFFQHNTDASVSVASGATFSWQTCISQDVTFIKLAGATFALPVAAKGIGNTARPLERLNGFHGDMLRNGDETINRLFAVNTDVPIASGRLQLTYWTARSTATYGNVRVNVGTVAAAATPTYAAIGVYQVNADDSLTLIGSTASDTTLFNGTFAAPTRALQAAVNLVAGQRYALGILVVTAAATPTFYGSKVNSLEAAAQQPFIAATVASQSALPASIAVGSLSSSGAGVFYGAVAP
jgi:hypothetical protein